MNTCEYCGEGVLIVYRLEVDDEPVELCAACRADIRYCAAKGQIPQEEA